MVETGKNELFYIGKVLIKDWQYLQFSGSNW